MANPEHLAKIILISWKNPEMRDKLHIRKCPIADAEDIAMEERNAG